jgi:hypothetical protein
MGYNIPMSDSPPQSGARRAAFILAVWADGNLAAWRGYLEAGDGRRWYFETLAWLNHLLVEASGWAEPPGAIPKQPPNQTKG